MEEELQKRNTDCVYFLASPLTCKKGAECEYRHSEMARLNPRDCWYWLSSSCLNPNCAFRHPPLDGHTETSSEPAPNQSAVPPNKTSVPCYFFQNGYCNKGERCSFLHGPVDNLPTWKSSNTTSVNPDGQHVEKKTSVGSDAGSAPVGTRSNSFETGSQRAAGIKKAPQLDIHQSAPNTVKPNASPLTSGSPYEDAEAGRPNSPLAAAGSFHRRSHTSSPGFDVLVDDGSEELDYEDDPEHLLHHDGEGRELNGQYLQYDYEENAEDDRSYPGSSFLYRKEGHDYDDHLGAEHIPDYVREGPAHSKGSVLDRIMPRKRKFLPRESASNGQRNMDLRDLLKRRRVVDGDSRDHVPRRLESSELVSRSRERPRFQGERRLHGRRASELEVSFSGSRIEGEDRSRHSHFDRSRLQEKPQLLLSEVSGNAASRNRSYTEDSIEFTGPKTLAEIKGEKKRSKENGDPSDRSGSSGGIADEDFRRPKTLREILEEKRRLAPMIDGNDHSS